MSSQKSVCRTCLCIVEKNCFTYVDDENNYIENVGRIRDLIMFCVPELDLYVSAEPIVCNDCLRMVISLYNFKNKCLTVEATIKNYMKRNNLQDYSFVNLNCVVIDETKLKTLVPIVPLQNIFQVVQTEPVNVQPIEVKSETITKTEPPKVEEQQPVTTEDDLGERFEETVEERQQTKPNTIIMYEEDIKEEPMAEEPDDAFSSMEIVKNETPEDNPQKRFSLVIKIDKKKVDVPEEGSKGNGESELPPVQIQDINDQFASTKMYKCEPCDFITSNCEEAKQHALKHTNDGQSFNCTICPFSTINVKLLNRHIARMHEASERLQCDMCSYRTRSSESLQNHRATLHYYNESNGMYKCPLCPYKCLTPYLVNKHIETKHIKKNELKCEFCSYQTKDKSNFRKHVFTHGTKPLQCHLCPYQCISPYQMRRHIKRNHEGHDIENYKITSDTVVNMIKQLQQKES